MNIQYSECFEEKGNKRNLISNYCTVQQSGHIVEQHIFRRSVRKSVNVVVATFTDFLCQQSFIL